MHLIIGLGNPGKEYENTRHNMGYKAIDELSKDLNIGFSKDIHKAQVGVGEWSGNKLILAKPQTFMNLSGESVGELARWHKIPASNIIIIYDDMDIPLGEVRIRASGADGGHNGMKSIISHLGTKDFPRIRIGIGRPDAGKDPSEYVLSRFTKQEAGIGEMSAMSAKDAAKMIITDGIDAAMNRYNK
jgi:peptidyl-tRNA hydrolase, PTH1 family